VIDRKNRQFLSVVCRRNKKAVNLWFGILIKYISKILNIHKQKKKKIIILFMSEKKQIFFAPVIGVDDSAILDYLKAK